MRSTARWVLPVLVGPSTAMSREGAVPADLSFMELNLADHAVRRKGRRFSCALSDRPGAGKRRPDGIGPTRSASDEKR